MAAKLVIKKKLGRPPGRPPKAKSKSPAKAKAPVRGAVAMAPKRRGRKPGNGATRASGTVTRVNFDVEKSLYDACTAVCYKSGKSLSSMGRIMVQAIVDTAKPGAKSKAASAVKTLLEMPAPEGSRAPAGQRTEKPEKVAKVATVKKSAPVRAASKRTPVVRRAAPVVPSVAAPVSVVPPRIFKFIIKRPVAA